MDKLIAVLKIKVIKGINLVVMDTTSSDPHVIITMGSQKVKTRTVKNNCNPVWNDEVSLAVDDLDAPIKLFETSSIGWVDCKIAAPLQLSVFDQDTFTGDDHMGDADIDIKPYIEYLRAGLADLPEGHVVHKVTPNRANCLAEESPIIWNNGKLVQDMILRLKNAATGEVEIQLEWVNVRGCKGLGS